MSRLVFFSTRVDQHLHCIIILSAVTRSILYSSSKYTFKRIRRHSLKLFEFPIELSINIYIDNVCLFFTIYFNAYFTIHRLRTTILCFA